MRTNIHMSLEAYIGAGGPFSPNHLSGVQGEANILIQLSLAFWGKA